MAKKLEPDTVWPFTDHTNMVLNPACNMSAVEHTLVIPNFQVVLALGRCMRHESTRVIQYEFHDACTLSARWRDVPPTKEMSSHSFRGGGGGRGGVSVGWA